MNNRFFIVCVAVIIFNMSINTLVNINEMGKPDVEEKSINGSVVIENDEPVKDEEENEDNEPEQQTIINNIDNSTTNNIIEEHIHYTIEEDEEVVSAPVNNNTNSYNYNNNNTSSNYNTNTNKNSVNSKKNVPIGDERNDISDDPNIVHIKGIKCPSCGAHTYIEHYNKLDTNLQYYMGSCTTCGLSL